MTMVKEDKIKIVQQYIKKYEKKDGTKAIIDFGSNLDLECKVIVPPIAAIEKLLSTSGFEGGFPRGKFSVIAGPEKTGKTTLLLQTIAHDMSLNKEAIWAWIDAENAFDETWATRFNIDMDRLIIIKDGTMEELLQRVIDLSKLRVLTGIVVDSVGGLTPKAEVQDSKGSEHELEHTGMLDLQKKLGQFFRMANSYVASSSCAVILIAHVYQDINSYGGGQVVKGGNSLKHWGHVRLMLSRLQDKATAEVRIMPDGTKEKIFTGHDVKIKLDKTRQNDKEGQFVIVPFRYGIGFDCLESAITVGINLNIIVRAGPTYTFGELKFKGRDALTDHFKTTKSSYEDLIKAIQSISIESLKIDNEEEE